MGSRPVLETCPFENQTYAFKICHDSVSSRQFILSIEDSKNKVLCTSTTGSSVLSVIMVYSNGVFLRIVENGIIQSTNSATGIKPFKFKVQPQDLRSKGCFYISIESD